MSPKALRCCHPAVFVGQLILINLLAGPVLFVTPVAADSWSYIEGQNGPSDWPGMCQGGTRQSPIDLDPEEALPGYFEPLALINYDTKVTGNLTNNGHTVALTMQQPCRMVMAAGGLPGVYHLEQIHFHWKSEHTLVGKRWPLEMHIVHYDRKYPNLNEAAKHHQGLAVLGVLFYETKEPNPKLQVLLDAVTKISAEGTTYKIPQQLSPQDFLPNELDRFYRYPGSLTTPDCAESVVWTVLTELVPISRFQMQQFYTIQSHFKPLYANYRPIQKRHNRPIYLQQPSEEISKSSRLHHSWLVILMMGLFSVIG